MPVGQLAGKKLKNIVILISGGGSNMAAIVRAADERTGDAGAQADADAAAAADRHAVQRHDPAPGAGGQGDLAAAQHARGLVEVQRRRGRERGAGRGAEGDPREGLELSKSQRS